MATIGLGEANRFMRVIPDPEEDVYPDVKKVAKFRKHLTMAEDVAFLPDNRVVVCDTARKAVRIYGDDGKFSDTLAKHVRPKGIATTPSGMVALIDSKKKKEKCIKVFSSENGDVFSKWGEEYNWKPRGLCFSNKGHLIVSDIRAKSHSVGVYTMDGRQLSSFGSLGSMSKNFNHPHYVAMDMFDRIIVSDKDNHAIKLFDERGRFLGKIGGYGSGEGQFCYPRGVCTDSRGNIIVCDTGNKRVCSFSYDGRYIQDLLSSKDGIGHPFGVAFNRESGRLVVTQHHSAREGGRVRKVRVYEMDKLSPLNMVRETTMG